MFLEYLYEVLIDNVDIQIWYHDWSISDERIIFEGKLFDSRKAVDPYMECRVDQIEVDDHGKLYVLIEVDD